MTDLFNTRWLSLADHAYREATAAAVDRGLPTAEARRHGLSAVVDAVRGLLGDEEPREGSVVPDTRTDPPGPGSGDEGYTVADLLAAGREIWGDRDPWIHLSHVVSCVAVVLGDLARQAREQAEGRPVDEQRLRRELGNLVVSSIRWADDLGLDVGECIAAALEAQRAFVAGGRAGLEPARSDLRGVAGALGATPHGALSAELPPGSSVAGGGGSADGDAPLRSLQERAVGLAAAYDRHHVAAGRSVWGPVDHLLGFVGDVGDLAKLAQAFAGRRQIDGARERLGHELADCLWSVLVLAEHFGVDLAVEFAAMTEQIERSLAGVSSCSGTGTPNGGA